MEACDLIQGYLSKAAKKGPGSRGGKVLRTLPNGKDVYQAKAGTDPGYAHFTAQDHKDAAEAHSDAHKQAHAKSSAPNATPAEVKSAQSAMQRHSHNAHRHRLMADTLKQKAGGNTAKSNNTNIYNEADMEACDILGDYLAKAGTGPGSRGGNVIGKTRSGKPVYASGEKTTGYDVRDHHDAMDRHSAEQKKMHQQSKAPKDKNTTVADHKANALKFSGQAGAHGKLADRHSKLATKLKAMGKSDRNDAEYYLHKSDWSASDVLGAYLAKANTGAGSRGGSILGYTKTSHKPIYASDSASSTRYKNFTSKDHGEAGELHHEQASRHREYALHDGGDGYHLGMEAHHASRGDAHFDRANAKKSLAKSDGDGDHGHEWADANNADPDRILVRQVGDVNHSALNDAIAASWPGMGYMAHSTQTFCNMANSYTPGE
ncbi:MAG: hypothetical protein EOO40_00060 [Deltaproteobacteria bacterium]|nr:MAG: hypothetical protein EOO40_00060 [Deltaproteobacteria bacterium]